MAGPRDDLKPRIGDYPGHLPMALDRAQGIVCTAEYQGRDTGGAQRIALVAAAAQRLGLAREDLRPRSTATSSAQARMLSSFRFSGAR